MSLHSYSFLIVIRLYTFLARFTLSPISLLLVVIMSLFEIFMLYVLNTIIPFPKSIHCKHSSPNMCVL